MEFMFHPRRKCDLQVDILHDDGVGSVVKESKSDQQNWICVEYMSGGEADVDETVS